MKILLEIFSTRELSLMIWLAVLLFGSQFSKSIRESTSTLLRTFFQISIVVIILLSVSYSAGIVYLLYKSTFWNELMLKDSIFWFIGSGFLILFNITKAGKERDFFKNIFMDNIKLILILEFIVNFHTFSLFTELIVLPIITFLAIISAYAGLKEEYKKVKSLMDIIFITLGVILLIYSVRDMVTTSNTITWYTIKAFLLPLILTIAFLPCAYLIALYMNYEDLFVRLSFFLKKKDNPRFAKRRLILKCGFNLKKISSMSPLINEFYDESTREDIRRVIN